jgi:hypothetical protein
VEVIVVPSVNFCVVSSINCGVDDVNSSHPCCISRLVISELGSTHKEVDEITLAAKEVCEFIADVN